MGISSSRTQVSADLTQIAAESLFVRNDDWDSGYDQPMGAEMQLAFELQIARTHELMNHYKRRNRQATNAVEAFVTKAMPFNDPGLLTTQRDRKAAAEVVKIMRRVMNYNRERSPGQPYLPEHIVAEFTHSVSDFQYLTLALVRRQLEQLSTRGICGDSCLDQVFADVGTVDYCERRGTFGIIPVESPNNAGCPHGEDCSDCAPTHYRFGEIERGFWSSDIYKDYVKWDWELRVCAQYGGWTDEVVRWMLRIQEERRLYQQASMLADENGYNTDIFKPEWGNIIEGANGVCNPSISCAADAVYILQNFDKQWAYHRTQDNLLVCDRDFIFVTPDKDVECAVTRAQQSNIIEKSEVTDLAGTCIGEVETDAPACLPRLTVCYDRYLREAMGEAAAAGTFFIIPVTNGDQDAFQRGAVRGFEQSVIARKASQFTTLSGRPLNEYGSDYCWREEVGFFRGYGMGTDRPELAFASDGSNTPCP